MTLPTNSRRFVAPSQLGADAESGHKPRAAVEQADPRLLFIGVGRCDPTLYRDEDIDRWSTMT